MIAKLFKDRKNTGALHKVALDDIKRVSPPPIIPSNTTTIDNDNHILR